MSFREKMGLISISVICFIAFVGMFLISPIPQNPSYHLFVDTRTILSVPNFGDVMSNLAFLYVGVMGINKLLQGKLKIIEDFKSAYLILFVGIALVAIGSAFYHLWPNNQTLVWDRLPMTVAFMALITIIVAEFGCLKRSKIVFWPLLLLGALSVIYWISTENAGQGDLRFYGLVQFLPMICIPIILICFKSKFSHANIYWWVLICYLAAKLFEHFDGPTYSALGFISGHTLKHLAAALGVWLLLVSFQKRKQVQIT